MLRRGEVFAGYVIEREVGRGGMGSVYAARHPRLPRLIALKLLHRELFGENETRTRFEREADVIAQLDHPNIITVYDRGDEDEQLWIAMQYVDGVDCASIDPYDLTPDRAVEIIVQTAAALDYAHQRGVLHRDVKPANILLSRSGGIGTGFTERALLSDFGIARVLDDTAHLTRTGMLNATLAYASPEQLTSAPMGPRSDQYSLACTLFRLLTGRGPFDAPNIATVMLGHLQSPPPSARALRPGLPADLDAVLRKALAKDPRDRYETCFEFAQTAWETVAEPVSLVRRPRAAGSAWIPREDTVLGCLFGGAVGDALGAPIETMLLPNIRQRYGISGVTGEGSGYKARISDETQLALFSMEAIIRGARAREAGTAATVGMIQENLLVWLRGQGQGALPEQPVPLQSGLTGYPELMTNRGPTQTTISAMRRVAARQRPGVPLGTREHPINDSKGCAAVVRSAPCGLTPSLEYAFELACDAAALTHGNPSGWLPAGALAAMVFGLCRGLDVRAAAEQARAQLIRHRDHEETTQALDAAVRLADTVAFRGRPMPPPGLLEKLGTGVIGSEALAMGVCAAICAENVGGTPEQVFRNGVLLAVNHSGDSDSTGAICGALLGARLGVHAIPQLWRTRLDAAAAIERLAADFGREFRSAPQQPGSTVPWSVP
ncbi:ADP-ribosylglycohydrolase family protein [Nocardia seriolae]|uniref:non-specific serine/threonine protein kinase n=1 Tax=Nocardia seriolae TaxID=37332 RepID=A0ABC8B387_9NOCA|nr:ADP-ribosylglycohydrolase family protein [Nocardia seriolae]APB00660.1 Non-specific serine/threonine protein kinase [Nocardia seriolae]MTJ61849.1 protein kinase [Nocardia seriolae]MTJ74689.1 protein kinase [Nocardia seriolae]MTJ90115.1 protein kinase [Nocardia seriolae]MTK34081.1 protein kinase [Nocardia seriolae]